MFIGTVVRAKGETKCWGGCGESYPPGEWFMELQLSTPLGDITIPVCWLCLMDMPDEMAELRRELANAAEIGQ